MRENLAENEFMRNFLLIKRLNRRKIESKQISLKRKLKKLREEKLAGQGIFVNCAGSRNIRGFKYIKSKDRTPYEGVPFPLNLRLHRQDRPHRSKYPPRRQHEVLEEEKAQRNPIILTKNPNFVLPEAGKTLMRLGPKTCPTSTGPIDERALLQTYVRFREHLS